MPTTSGRQSNTRFRCWSAVCPGTRHTQLLQHLWNTATDDHDGAGPAATPDTPDTSDTSDTCFAMRRRGDSAPPAGHTDPTLWLPDELLIRILKLLAMYDVYHCCAAVCRRWRHCVGALPITNRFLLEARFAKYGTGYLAPSALGNAVNNHGQATVSALARSPTGRLYSGSGSGPTPVGAGAILVWGKDGGLLHTLSGHTDGVNALVLGPGPAGELVLYSGSDDGSIRSWATTAPDGTAEGAALGVLAGHGGAVNTLAVSPVDGRLFSGSQDSSIAAWSPDGVRLFAMTGHTDGVYALAMTPDGTRLFSGSSDGTIRVWTPADGAPIATLSGHGTKAVWTLAMSPDGRRLFSGSADKTIKAWDPASGALVHTMVGHTDEVEVITVSPDGARLFSGSWDTTIRSWSVDGAPLCEDAAWARLALRARRIAQRLVFWLWALMPFACCVAWITLGVDGGRGVQVRSEVAAGRFGRWWRHGTAACSQGLTAQFEFGERILFRRRASRLSWLAPRLATAGPRCSAADGIVFPVFSCEQRAPERGARVGRVAELLQIVCEGLMHLRRQIQIPSQISS